MLNEIILHTSRAFFAWIPLSIVFGNFRVQMLFTMILIGFFIDKNSLFFEISFGLIFGSIILLSYQIVKNISDAIEFIVFDGSLNVSELGTSSLNKFCLVTFLTPDVVLKLFSSFSLNSFDLEYLTKIYLDFGFLSLILKLVVVNLLISLLSVFFANLNFNSEIIFIRFLILSVWLSSL